MADLPRESRDDDLDGNDAVQSGTRIAGTRSAAKWKHAIIRASFVMCVLLPSLVTALYYGFFAADQYASEVRFAVRSQSTSGGGSTDMLGAMTGLPAAMAGLSDSYIVMDYVQSRDVVDKLEAEIRFRQIYSRSEADFWTRLNPNLPVEDLVRYWRSIVRVNFDTLSQIISIEVRAFTAEDAKLVATTLLTMSEALVNDISAQARADAVRSSLVEVKRAEDRVKAIRATITEFRTKQKELDPMARAQAQLAVQGKLDEELTKARTEIANLRRYMGDSAPTVDVLKNRIKSLEAQIAEERTRLSVSGPRDPVGQETLTSMIATYEELQLERDFADKNLQSAQASLERARVEADRQQRYMATFVRPQLPQMAIYPKRYLNVLIVFAMALALWTLAVLMYYAISDHTTS